MRRLGFAFTMLTMLASAQSLQVHGHRGARAVLPENTLPAFEYAVGLGIDVLELDMAVTKDDVVVVSHDPHMNATICKGPKPGALIRELTLEEVRAYDCGGTPNPQFPKQQARPGTKMPTLDEVFALKNRGKFLFNIETKISPQNPEWTVGPERFVELVLAIIRKHGLEDRVILQSFDFRTLVAMKKAAPEIRLAALLGSQVDWLEAAKASGAGIISPMYPLVTREKVEAAHKAGLQVVPWTPNTRELWEKLRGDGVDGIITDDPGPLMGMLGRGK